MALPRLTYFSSRGRAELIRLLLADAGVEHDEVAVGAWSPTDLPADFVALRASGALAYDALPLWEEPDGFRLVQSDAILRHLARSHGYYGACPREAARCDELIAAVEDARTALRKRAPERWLGLLEQRLPDDGFVVGAAPSIADVALWHFLETVHDNALTAGLAVCPRLTSFYARFGARPGLAAYRASERRYPPQPFV